MFEFNLLQLTGLVLGALTVGGICGLLLGCMCAAAGDADEAERWYFAGKQDAMDELQAEGERVRREQMQARKAAYKAWEQMRELEGQRGEA